MKALICTQCGGQIDPLTYRCHACGTAYEKPVSPVHEVKVVSESPLFASIGARVDVSALYLHNGDITGIAEMAMKDITHQLAEAITPFVDVQTGYDIRRDKFTIQGTVRVKKPEGCSMTDMLWLDHLRHMPH